MCHKMMGSSLHTGFLFLLSDLCGPITTALKSTRQNVGFTKLQKNPVL